MDKWDSRFLQLAEHISDWSKDPSTQAGAVLIDEHKRVVSVGYNGFPRKVRDSTPRYDNRELKYKLVVHAEVNAILFAHRIIGCTLYTWPFQPCIRCAVQIIQVGIWRVVSPPTPADKAARWAEEMNLAQDMFHEAAVKLDILG